MGAVGRRPFQGACDDLRNLFIADLARSARARFVVEPIQTALGKAPAPLADRVRVRPHPLHNGLVLEPVGRRQDNPRPPRQALSRLPAPGQTFQLTPFRFRKGDRHRRSAHRSALQ